VAFCVKRLFRPYSPDACKPYFFIFARSVLRAIPRRRAVSRILPLHWVRPAAMSCRSYWSSASS